MSYSVWVERVKSRPVVLGSSLLAAFILQTSVFPHLTVFGLKPDLLMVVVACWGLLYGPQEGFVAGLAAGLTQDLVFAQYTGLFALAKCLVGLAMGVIQGHIFKESVWVSTGAVGVAVYVHEFIVWTALKGFGVPASAATLLTVALPGALYSMVFTPLVYRQLLVYRMAEWAREREAAGGPSASGQR